MKRLRIVWIAVFFVLAAPPDGVVRGQGSLQQRVDAYIKLYQDIGSFSGTIFIARDGKVLVNTGYGNADYQLGVPNAPDTKFYLASNTKLFTATAIMLLQERGLLKVEDALSRFLPEFPNAHRLTIHQLLIHKGGLSADLPVQHEWEWTIPRTLDEQLRAIAPLPLAAEPGTSEVYSNNGYRLLAAIIEKVSGTSYGAFLKTNIFDRLGMTNSGHDDDPVAIIANRASGYTSAGATTMERAVPIAWVNKTGNGSLYSTVGDLYKFDRALYTNKLLSQVSRDQMFTVYVRSGRGTSGYGCFVWEQFGSKVVGYNGRAPGFASEVRRYLDRDTFIAILSNHSDAPVIQMVTAIGAMVFGEPVQPPAFKPPVAVVQAVLDTYVGRYGGRDFESATLIVEKKNGELRMIWHDRGGGVSVLVPQSETAFFDKSHNGTVTFVKGPTGQITRLVYRSRGVDAEFRRVMPR